ncbi:MAG: TrkA C-terminal domain-containing protein [bacterium]
MLFHKNSDKTIILGINQLSINLANKLSNTKDIIIIDSKYSEYINELDVIFEPIECDLYKTFKKLNINNTDIFISLTENDEYNLFAAELAKIYGVNKSSSIVRSTNYVNIENRIDYIFNPNQIMIQILNSKIKETKMNSISNIIPGKVDITLVGIKNEDKLSFKKVKDIKLEGNMIIAVKKNERIIIPEPDTKLYPGDSIYILYRRAMFTKFLNLINRYKNKRSLFIVGATDLGEIVYKNWKNIFSPIIFVEPDERKCNLFAEKMENTLILHGEGIDIQLLKEEGLNKSSIYLAVSSDTLSNLLGCYTAKQLGCQNVFPIIYQTIYKSNSKMLGLENALIVPDIISNNIINCLIKDKGVNRYILGKKIYISRIKINKKSNVVDKRIKNINITPGIIIGVIERSSKIIIPDNNTVIKVGDELIVFFYKKLESSVYVTFNSKNKAF